MFKIEVGDLVSKTDNEPRKNYDDRKEIEVTRKERFYECSIGKAISKLMKFPEWKI